MAARCYIGSLQWSFVVMVNKWITVQNIIAVLLHIITCNCCHSFEGLKLQNFFYFSQITYDDTFKLVVTGYIRESNNCVTLRIYIFLWQMCTNDCDKEKLLCGVLSGPNDCNCPEVNENRMERNIKTNQKI